MNQQVFTLKTENKLEPALVVGGLSFSYPGQPCILQDISLRIQPGEKVGLIGPNGAGKSTFFLLICGVLRPAGGQIILFGKPSVVGEFRPEIGLVFQNPNDQLFSPSVRDDVAFGPENMGLSEEEIDKRVQESLYLTGVEHLAQRVPHNLSGGEKCMVAIAGVLAMRPKLILYDEPSANLDLRARRRLISFLQTSQETNLISSHDLELILEVCDRVILLNEGHIIADGKANEIMRDKQLMEAHGLEKPHSLLTHPHNGK